MALQTPTPPSIDCSPEEWQARLDLACAYRLFHHLGWHSLIYNHITLRVPGPETHFLINPFGLMYREVTASNLLKVDLDGNVLSPSPWPLFEAGFVVHSAVHAAREDVACVMHTHTDAGVAVACQADGLLPLDLVSLNFTDRVAYHDLEGITVDRGECARIAANLGARNVLILRNHGLLTCGPTIGVAFQLMYLLDQACRVQLMAQASGAALNFPSLELGRRVVDQKENHPANDNMDMLWTAMRRWMTDLDPGYMT
jgi:ribulose-5-phosphate 4-epimerase/fuculose-1-phosphate aldolase